MKIHLRLNGQVVAATLARNRTARELVAMLPLTITMHDLFRREKFGALPAPISGKGTRTQSYEVGDMVCWGPGPDLAIFYRHDGQKIRGGVHVVGKLDASASASAFEGPGPLSVTLELPAADAASPCAALQSGKDREAIACPTQMRCLDSAPCRPCSSS